MRLGFFLIGALVSLSIPLGVAAYHFWSQKLDAGGHYASGIGLYENQWVVPAPSEGLYLKGGTFQNELAAYLRYDYLRGRPEIVGHRVLLTVQETPGGPNYEIRLEAENNLLHAIPYASLLKARRLVPGTELEYTTRAELAKDREQTEVFEIAYSGPVHPRLEDFTPGELLSPVATFLTFKSSTDQRNHRLNLAALSGEEARQLAADIIAVANFYSLPLDVFLGVGAMENNYLNVDGDLDHRVWKRRPAKGDIVIKRSRRRVLVLNYSIGRWQITRETLRKAHEMFLRDTRDYSQLPERLRPARKLDFAKLDSHVLTTYAGLVLRNLMDRFPGKIADAVGAYNGGVKSPNLEYAAGVALVADYARTVLEHTVSVKTTPEAAGLSTKAISGRAAESVQ
jgi:hypothetical protein